MGALLGRVEFSGMLYDDYLDPEVCRIINFYGSLGHYFTYFGGFS